MDISKLRTYYRAVKSFCTNAKSDIHENIVNALFPPLKPAYQKAPAHSPKSQLHRMAERGNVFFTLFGAVAVVGTLGAGIMSTMRGPLSTMVEVNRREQAKAEVRLATGLVLVNAADGCSDADGFTEGDAPTGAGPTGGGSLPVVGAPQSDPWGTAYGYCAWDHGTDVATTGGCAGGDILAGNTNANNIAVAIISAGPDRVFQTSCHADGSGDDYIRPDGGGGDDIVVTQTYNQAVSGSGGLWEVTGADTASIDRDLTVDGTADFTGDINLSGGSGALRLGAASLFLPNQTTLSTCNSANNTLLRVNTSGSTPVIEICDGSTANWLAAGSAWSNGTGSDVYYNTGTPQVGIGTNSPDDTLDVVGTAQITGATVLDSTLSTGGLATLESLAVTNGATFNSTVTFNQPLVGDTVITGSAATGTTDALTVRNSTPSTIFTVQNNGRVGINDSDPSSELDVDGDINVTGALLTDGVRTLYADSGKPGTILLGMGAAANIDLLNAAPVADNNTILGAGAASSLISGSDNIVIGQGVDIADSNSQLNIGNAITGNLITGDIAVAGDLTVTGNNIALGTNTAGNILVNDGTSFGSVALSGDANIANDGTLTLTANSVDTTEITNQAVTEDKLDTSNTPENDDCLRYVSGELLWAECSSNNGGDGLGGEGLEDVLINGTNAGGRDAVNFGKVGIGVVSPTALLELPGIQIGVSGDASLGPDIQFSAQGLIAATSAVRINAGSVDTASGSQRDIIFASGSATNAATEVMRIRGESGTVVIGSTVASTGLTLDVAGRVGATEYCDENGLNCTSPTVISNLADGTAGDDLGDHTATQDLNMAENNVLDAGSVIFTKVTSQPAPDGGAASIDTLAGLSCANTQVAKWNGSAWACAADDAGTGGAACSAGSSTAQRFNLVTDPCGAPTTGSIGTISVSCPAGDHGEVVSCGTQGATFQCWEGTRQRASYAIQITSNSGRCSCFTAETMVAMADGTSKEIHLVTIGDKVIGSDGSINNVVDIDRTLMWKGKKQHLIRINGEKEFMTDNHPVMTTAGWKALNPGIAEREAFDILAGKVSKLEIGDEIVNADGTTLKINSIDIVPHEDEEKRLYNLHLDGDHTYVANGMVVHGVVPDAEGRYTLDRDHSGETSTVAIAQESDTLKQPESLKSAQ